MADSAAPPQTVSTRLVPPKPSALSNGAAENIRRERDRLRSLVERDFKDFPTAETLVRSNLGEALSEEAVASANKIAGALKIDLEKQGFEVTIEKRVSISAKHNGVDYVIPEHQSLMIRPGTANGPFAREIHRYEKYIAARKRDALLPAELKTMDFFVRVDPLVSVAQGSIGFVSLSDAYGRGLHLSPAAVFIGQDVTLEVMRHELRHIKNYFDVMSGKPSANRAILIDHSAPLSENLSGYENIFVIDEIEGFTANLRNSQSKIGRETEAYRKRINDQKTQTAKSAEEVNELKRQYERAVGSIQREARLYADRIENFITTSYENATVTRTMIADPSNSTAKFASRMSIAERPQWPGVAEVSIDVSKEGKGKGKKLVIQIPTSVTEKGTEAIKEYAINYLVQLDSYLLDRKRELLIRRTDVDRDPMSRLPLHSRPSATNPDSN